MNARDVLREWAEHAETHIGTDCADSRALRELDQLLSDMANCIKYDCERNNNGPVNKQLLAIELRLAQAGYGER